MFGLMSNKIILKCSLAFRDFGDKQHSATSHQNLHKDSVYNVNYQTFHCENVYVINIFTNFHNYY